jgi:putative nucleotidyltransferase with HDIG domain
MDIVKSKIDGFVKARTIPPVLNALLAELDKNEPSPNSIAKIIGQDISLTARMLRVANSAFYRRQTEVKTVPQAISLLGTQAVKALALSVSLFDITGGFDHSKSINFKDFWRHNLEVAVLANHFASQVKGLQQEEAFACGLLHDLGVVFFLQMMPQEYAEVLEKTSNGVELETAEMEVIGITHTEAGSQIAAAWNLPLIFREATANHHLKNIRFESDSIPALWVAINLAHQFCRNGIDVAQSISIERIEERQMLALDLKISPEAIITFMGSVGEEVVSMASYLDIDIGDPWLLLTRANNQMGDLYWLYEKALINNNRLESELLRINEKRLTAEAMGTVLYSFGQLIKNSHDTIRDRLHLLESGIKTGSASADDKSITNSIETINRAMETVDAIFEELKRSAESKAFMGGPPLHISEVHQKIKARLARLNAKS